MLTWISLLFFAVFPLVAAVDGIYDHLHRFRLWAQRDTWWEHVLHTAGPGFGALVAAALLGSTAAAAHHVALAVRGAPGCCALSRGATS